MEEHQSTGGRMRSKKKTSRNAAEHFDRGSSKYSQKGPKAGLMWPKSKVNPVDLTPSGLSNCQHASKYNKEPRYVDKNTTVEQNPIPSATLLC